MQNISRTNRHILLSLLVWIITAGVTWAQQGSVRPGINDYYMDPDFETWVSRFESPGREVYDQRYKILAALDIKPGMAIADIGAGTGLYTLLFADKVGSDGLVYAVDISKVFMENVARRVQHQGLKNVRTIVSTHRDTLLAASSIDLAFLSDTYHHFEYPQDMLASIHKALKPGGTLAVIDFRKQAGVSSGWVMGHVRANRELVTKEIEAAGFEFSGREDWLQTNYFLRFRKKS